MQQLDRYITAFGIDNIQVLSIDALKSAPAETVADVCRFIGVRAPPAEEVFGVHNPGLDSLERPEVPKGLFRSAFADDLEKLQSILPVARDWRERLPV